MCCYIHHANWKYFIVYSMRGHSCLEKKIVGRFSRTHVKYAAKAGSEALLLTVLFCIKRKKKKKQGGIVCWISGLAPACQNNHRMARPWIRPGRVQAATFWTPRCLTIYPALWGEPQEYWENTP